MIQEYKPLKSVASEKVKELGIDHSILKKFELLNADTANIHIDLNDWAFPIVYFDSKTSFEFRFTAFQHDWSDDSQLKRFYMALSEFNNSRDNNLIN